MDGLYPEKCREHLKGWHMDKHRKVTPKRKKAFNKFGLDYLKQEKARKRGRQIERFDATEMISLRIPLYGQSLCSLNSA